MKEIISFVTVLGFAILITMIHRQDAEKKYIAPASLEMVTPIKLPKHTIKKVKMSNQAPHTYGIEGQKAPELQVPIWLDGEGNKTSPITLREQEGKFKVIYCFQAWCPGCHSRGLPALQKMTEALKDSDKVTFMAIQTVFEGSSSNTFERMKEVQKQYDLKIPFGHDTGNESTRNISSTMMNYKTGGTPWFIFIDQEGTVIFNDYHLNTEKAIEYLSGL